MHALIIHACGLSFIDPSSIPHDDLLYIVIVWLSSLILQLNFA